MRIIVIAIVIGLLTFVPSVYADDIGTPPTKTCETIRTRLHATSHLDLSGSRVDSTGKLVFIDETNSASYHGSRITKIDLNCNTVWSLTTGASDVFGCTGTTPTNYCELEGLGIDARNDVIVLVRATSPSFTPNDLYKLCRLDGTTGSLDICSDNFDDIPELLNTGLDTAARAIDGIEVSDTAVAYLFRNSASLVRFDENLDFVYAVNAGAPTAIRGDQQPDIAYIDVPPNGAVRRVDQGTGAILHTATYVTGLNQAPSISASNAYAMTSQTDITYGILNKDTFATVVQDSTVPPNLEVSAVGVSSRAGNWQADAADDMLICGTADEGGTPHSYIVNADTSLGMNAPITWAHVIDIVGYTNAQSNAALAAPCDFDYVGGFWVGGTAESSGTRTSWIQRYPSTGFVQPSAPQLIGPTVTGLPVIDQVQTGVATGFGVSMQAAGWLLGLGLVGMIVWRVRDASVLVVGIMALIAIGLAVQFELLPVWLLLLIVFLIIAIAGTVMFARGKEDE